MKRYVQAVIVLLLLTPLSACEYAKLQEIKYAEPVGTPFQNALWTDYRDLSKAEELKYNWRQAVVYADKALKAAYGEDVQPEDFMRWKLPADTYPQFEKARADLMNILGGDAKSVRPQLVADAQTHFDCWVDKQHYNYHPEDTAFCRDAFYDDMQQLLSPDAAKKMTKPTVAPAAVPVVKKAKPIATAPEKKAEAAPPPAAFLPPPADLTPVPAPAMAPEPTTEPAVEPTPATEPTPAIEPAPAVEPAPSVKPLAPISMKQSTKEVESASYIVFFDPGQATLTPAAEKIVDNAAQSLLQHKAYQVAVNARTDLFGNVASDLPGKRAQMVKDRLILQGVSETSIALLIGEASPSAGSQPAHSQPVERRVEIFISE